MLWNFVFCWDLKFPSSLSLEESFDSEFSNMISSETFWDGSSSQHASKKMARSRGFFSPFFCRFWGPPKMAVWGWLVGQEIDDFVVITTIIIIIIIIIIITSLGVPTFMKIISFSLANLIVFPRFPLFLAEIDGLLATSRLAADYTRFYCQLWRGLWHTHTQHSPSVENNWVVVSNIFCCHPYLGKWS